MSWNTGESGGRGRLIGREGGRGKGVGRGGGIGEEEVTVEEGYRVENEEE